jgi:hypothetical protein
MRIFAGLILMTVIVLLTACSGNESESSTKAPNSSVLVDIVYPQSGSVIYSELIQIKGTVEPVGQLFRIQLIDPDDTVISQTVVLSDTTDWAIEVPLAYNGAPTETIVEAISYETPGETLESEIILDSATVLISNMDDRPNGIFGEIIDPIDGAELGGDSIIISGFASGIPDNVIFIELVAEDGSVVDSQSLTLENPYFVDYVFWRAELQIKGYVGLATLNAHSTSDNNSIIDEAHITIFEAAG